MLYLFQQKAIGMAERFIWTNIRRFSFLAVHKVCTKAILLGERSVRIREVKGSNPSMLHLSSWMTTLPMMLIGMTGILLVIGFLVLVMMALNCLTHRK